MGDERPENVRFLTGFSVGSRIAGYLLEEQIGQGGMAVVFRAQDERLQRQVALKVLVARAGEGRGIPTPFHSRIPVRSSIG